LLASVFVILYLSREVELGQELRTLAVILILFNFFLFSARFVIPAHTVIPYGFPVAAFGLTVGAMFGTRLAIVFSIPLAVLVAYDLPNSLDLTLYLLFGTLISILALRQARRLADFLWAGLAFAISGSLIIVAYRLLLPSTDLEGMVTLFAAAFFNGLVTASLSVLLQFLLAYVLGMTTQMQLMDLTRPDQPLLQYIMREAPGTYQHSLQLANLVEQAAERISADPLLSRVGALYHDAGKARNPAFFIENQVPGFPNPHDNLDPETSAEIIIRHVTDGLDLGKQYRLPRHVLDFISEHHGTMLARYQYVNAVKAADGDESKVDAQKFQYPGPRPQSRETAILMLADGSEARVRAERPMTTEQLYTLIKSVIDNRISQGQLDDTDLTLNDLDVILESFTSTLKGIYHPRVKYPELEQPTKPVADLPSQKEEKLSLPTPLESESVTDGPAKKPLDSTA
jgi:putative nucleotidyltransferase with HDIG domain